MDNPNWLTEKHIAQLWAKMARVYGHRWTSSFGEVDDGTWLEGLKGLLPDDLAAGYKRMVDSRNHSWPPTLPEFRSLCFGLSDKHIRVLALAELKQHKGSFDFNLLTSREIEFAIKRFMPDVIKNQEKELVDLNCELYKKLAAPR